MSFKFPPLSVTRRAAGAGEPAANWKVRAERRAARIVELERTIDDLNARLAAVDEKQAAAKRRLESRRHESLSPDILKQVLAVRMQSPTWPAYEREAARTREERLQQVSPEYRAAFDGSDEYAMEKVAADGLPWWIPLDPRVPDRVERASRHDLPLRAILQTREVALGGVMLDLGANLGRTCIPRVLLGDVRAVYAAEPHPANYACLVRNVAEHSLRGFVMPDRVAIGAERGEVQLRVSRFPGGHRVLRTQRRPVETITVDVWPVDLWLDRLGIEPGAITFVKVDTQGSEVRVLRGAESLLARRHVSWQMEVDPVLLKRAGTPLRDLFKLVQSRFTHFVDIGSHQRGPRSRPIRELREALAYLGTDEKRTDLIFYHAVS